MLSFLIQFNRFVTIATFLASPGPDHPLPGTPRGMARIPAGVYHPFFIGAKDPKEIQIKAFNLDILPVTTGQFLEFVRANPRWRRSTVRRIFADESYLTNWAADLDPGANAPLNTPVVYVSWFAAKAYADWKGQRLPSTAEWEYAAAAGFTRPDGSNDVVFRAHVSQWYASAGPRQLPAVGAGRKNFWGIQDLHGLIWEWTVDFNSAMATGDSRGDGTLDRRLFCGNGAQGARDATDYPAFMRYAFRSSLKADYNVHNLGFRCASDL